MPMAAANGFNLCGTQYPITLAKSLVPALGLFAFAFVLLKLARSIERGIDDGCFLRVVEFAWPRPPFHGDLLGALQGELVRRSARANCRSRANGRTGADAHRRHHHGAGTDGGPIVDDGGPFVGAIVIAGDAASPDVDILTHPRVAEVRQMIGLAARANLGV